MNLFILIVPMTSRSDIRALCTRYPQDSEVFALIDDLELVPCHHCKPATDWLLRQHRVISSFLREERDSFLRQLHFRRYVRSSDSGDLFGETE